MTTTDATGPTGLEMIVRGKTVLADGVVGLTLQPADTNAAVPEWAPGAHIDLVLPGDVVRQYSLCGRPADCSVLRIAVLREPAGRGGSAWVHDELTEGARVHVRGPRNHFQLIDADRYVFIAGGIGITPLLPMITEVSARSAKWRLVYGGRTRTSMAFRQELGARGRDRVDILPQDECGMLDLDGILSELPSGTAIYCCGPEALIAAVESRAPLYAECTLHVERFSARPDTGPRETFVVELAQSGVTLTVGPGESILEAVESAGLPVLSSCQEGTCGTCETPVLAGLVDHRDSILTDAERARNDAMMICVSRAAGKRLVLDL